MLELRSRCECCNADLPPESTSARICSFECTFCEACATGTLGGRCPNCGGELVARPRRAPSGSSAARTAVILGPGDGRSYPMGRIGAVFKADGPETRSRYAISEWWLEPHTTGPGPHSHPEDDVFYVIDGTMSIRVGDAWTDAARGAFVLVPGGVVHDFENRGGRRAGILNVSVPGDFEPHLPGIAEWFAEHPPGVAGSPPPPDAATATEPRSAP